MLRDAIDTLTRAVDDTVTSVENHKETVTPELGAAIVAQADRLRAAVAVGPAVPQ